MINEVALSLVFKNVGICHNINYESLCSTCKLKLVSKYFQPAS